VITIGEEKSCKFNEMSPARYYDILDDSKVQCRLCPHNCRISEGSQGLCGVRYNRLGRLYTRTYATVSALAVDPVEKKPLYHFFPGTSIYSVGSIGCTMKCSYCQNYGISQYHEKQERGYHSMDPFSLVNEMKKTGLQNIAFTYNEPVLSIEAILQLAPEIQKTGGKCAMVSNGYINSAPLEDLLAVISAFNIDLKAADDDVYKELSGVRKAPVVDTIRKIKAADKHLELTYLVVPGYNDGAEDFSKLCKWMAGNLGREQVLHISRYFPRYQMAEEATPLETIRRLEGIARKELDFVYCGNTGDFFDNNTYCPLCNNLLIKRSGYRTSICSIAKDKCSNCGKPIPGIF
jgi:pyruvate formate lyase activating enzyme